MSNPRFQHLTEAFNSIIQMMLASLRVGGWRALLDLPQMIIAAIYLRRLGREFAAIIASIDFSALPAAVPPAPDHQPAPAQPAPAAFPRPRLVASSDAPAQPDRARQAAQPITAAPTTTARRTRLSRYARNAPFARPRQAPDPQIPDQRTIISLPANLRDPDRTP